MGEGIFGIGSRPHDHRPGARVHLLIEAGQNDRPPRRPRDGRKEIGRRAIGSGRTDRDDRACRPALAQSSALRFDQRHLSPRLVDQSALRKFVRPMLDGNRQEIERDPPILIELGQNQRIEFFPSHILDDHFIDQACKLAG